MASALRRTDDLQRIKVRTLVLQNTDGTYATPGELLFVGPGGVVSVTDAHVDLSGNMWVQSLDVSGSVTVGGSVAIGGNVDVSGNLTVVGTINGFPSGTTGATGAMGPAGVTGAMGPRG